MLMDYPMYTVEQLRVFVTTHSDGNVNVYAITRVLPTRALHQNIFNSESFHRRGLLAPL